MLQEMRERLTHEDQMSDAFILSLVLSFSGGFQDAYTYVVRGHVFANAQTGNVVLMSTYFMQRQWQSGLHYLLPILAFALGVFVAENMQFHFKKAPGLHWRQWVVLLEIFIMLAVGFFPSRLDMAANILVSFACAMQVQAFRQVSGIPYASTMCIGNLRSGTAALSSYLRSRSALDRKKVRYYFSVILTFAIGAGVGGNLSEVFGARTIWATCFFLALGALMMGLDKKPREKQHT